MNITRRGFIRSTGVVGLAGLLAHEKWLNSLGAAVPVKSAMKLGLVTYLWGKDMKLPELIEACSASGLLGVEVRTEHAHGVEPSLSKTQRFEVRKQFDDSPVTLVGYGSNAQYHENDPAKLRHNIDLTKQYIRLMHDCGGSGVKVKPNALVKGVPPEKTIEQIAKALLEVAKDGDDFGQEIRVEVHGKETSDLTVIKKIFDLAVHPNLKVCWNCNDQDLQGAGLEHNFNLVKDRFGKTVHVREMDRGSYPYADLMKLFLGVNYRGWILLEARTNPENKVRAMIEQRRVFEELIAG